MASKVFKINCWLVYNMAAKVSLSVLPAEKGCTHAHQLHRAHTPSLSNESLHQATNREAGTTMPQEKLPAKKQCVRRSRDLVNPSPRPTLLLSLAQPLWALPGRPPATPPMLAYTEPALSNTHSWVWSFNQLKLVCLPSLIQWPKTFPSMFINNHKSHNESCVSP